MSSADKDSPYTLGNKFESKYSFISKRSPKATKKIKRINNISPIVPGVEFRALKYSKSSDVKFLKKEIKEVNLGMKVSKKSTDRSHTKSILGSRKRKIVFSQYHPSRFEAPQESSDI
jgi:hypothetical protein